MSILLGRLNKCDAPVYVDLDGNRWQSSGNARKECSRMDWEDVRKFCADGNFYTLGDNASYNNLAQLVYSWEEQDITVDMLQVVAEDILEHSDTLYNLEMVMFELSRKCVRRFYI